VRQAGAAILMLTIVVHSGCDRPSADPDPGIPLPIAEARQRAIQDLRYQLSLDIPETMTEPIGGTVAIRFTATDVSHPAVLDFDAGPNHLTSVRVGGQPSRYQEVNEHIVIPAGELTRGENTIEIAFRAGEAPLNRNPEFLYTIFVPARAHQAFPCFDQPDLKARFTLELTVPSNWQAVASGEPFGKAGAYAIQNGAAAWIEKIEGSYTGIMGLPLHETAALLEWAGLDVRP